MKIGVDFDNTIVCYDDVFHKAAVEKGWLVDGPCLPKEKVRDTLRAQGMEENWILLQGHVYGAAMSGASPYPGVIAFFQACHSAGIPVCIVSHKTRYPFRGPQHDLHDAARSWLVQQGFLDPGGAGLTEDRIFFELTKQEKIGRIAANGCTHFIDDLPEFLREPGWPEEVERILFDPETHHPMIADLRRVSSWAELTKMFFSLQACAY